MKKNIFAKTIIFILAIAAFFFAPAVFSHQPYLVNGEKEIAITDPEISKAYYGEFPGTPSIYTIKEDTPFKLYVGLLVPAGYGAPTDVSAEILKDGQVIAELAATSTKWERFYEPFGGDDYFQGPEFRGDATPGTYTITVSRPENMGKYVLAIGETESFTIDETIRTLGILPSLKSVFLGKPAWTAYLNRVGLFAGLGIVGVLIVLLLIQSFLKKLFSLFKKKKIVD